MIRFHTSFVAGLVAIIILAVLSMPLYAQFGGKDKLVSDKAIDPDIAYGTKHTVLVWGKNSFGLFWIENGGKALCFAKLNKAGKIKGGIKTIYNNDLLEITTIDAVWIGRVFVVLFTRTQVINYRSVHTFHLAKVNSKGKIKGGIKRINVADETDKAAIAWNGKVLGLAYWTEWAFQPEDNALFFLRVNKNLAAVGAAVQLMKHKTLMDINVATNGKGFVVAWRCDYSGKTIYLQRMSAEGQKVGNQVELAQNDEVECIRLINNGVGYTLIYRLGDPDIKMAFLDDQLNVTKNPFTINPATGDLAYHPVIMLHGNSAATGPAGSAEYWAFWREEIGYYGGSYSAYGIVGGKISTDGSIITTDKWLTEHGKDIEEIPAAVAGNGKVVILAYRRFVPHSWENDEGELWIRTMK